jgi:hypothetical protein
LLLFFLVSLFFFGESFSEGLLVVAARLFQDPDGGLTYLGTGPVTGVRPEVLEPTAHRAALHHKIEGVALGVLVQAPGTEFGPKQARQPLDQ